MKFKLFSLLATVALALSLSSVARADTCDGGQLSVTSGTLGNFAEACITVDGFEYTITDFFWNGVETTVKVFTIGWDENVTLTGDTDDVNGPWGPSGVCNGGACSDGWQSFFTGDIYGASGDSDGFNLLAGPDSDPGQQSFSWTFSGDPGDIAIHIGGFGDPNCSV